MVSWDRQADRTGAQGPGLPGLCSPQTPGLTGGLPRLRKRPCMLVGFGARHGWPSESSLNNALSASIWAVSRDVAYPTFIGVSPRKTCHSHLAPERKVGLRVAAIPGACPPSEYAPRSIRFPACKPATIKRWVGRAHQPPGISSSRPGTCLRNVAGPPIPRHAYCLNPT
jgi:hypothetical protein